MKSIPSSGPFLDSSRWAEAAAAADALRTLARGLSRARGFALFFAVCNKPVERDHLIAMLQEAMPGTPLSRVELAPEATDVLAEVARQAADPRGPVLIVNLEGAIPSGASHHEILAKLNLQRPQWPQQAPQPVVFWLPEYALGFIEREAPDFFDWRSDTVTFPELESEEIDHWRRFVWRPAVQGSLNKEVRLARIQELRNRLKAGLPSSDPVAISARANWLCELATQLAFTGEGMCESIQLHEKALGLYESLGDKRSRAMTLGEIARLRAAKGEVDQALKLYEEALAVFELLGDKRSWAVMLGDVARLRADKGEVDKALKLHEEALAVYELMGDKRERAVMLGDIARLLAAKGDVNQALKLTEEALTAFELLGDKRSRAVTLGDIARLRADKGDVDQALKLHEEALAVCETLGDLEGKANTLWCIAEIEIAREQWRDASAHLAESYAILTRLGRLDGICFVGLSFGQLLCRAGRRDEGMQILARSRDGFLKLGQAKMAEQTQSLMDMISRQSS